MAFRIAQAVIGGEIDNRTRGRVVGRIWLLGREDPIELDLKGNPLRDLAGHCLRFTNPSPEEENVHGLSGDQQGVVGDMTAARKVKVPDCSMDDVRGHLQAGTAFPWRWGNALYLEWFSERNGHVVIESTSYELKLEGEPGWEMSEAEETEQRERNRRGLEDFMTPTGGKVEMRASEPDPAEYEDEPPQSAAEAEADAEAARMDLLIDRIQARLEREGNSQEEFERIMEEERERLRRERGEPEPPAATPEEEEERRSWLEEANAAADEALADAAEEGWTDHDRPHPLVAWCTDLAKRLLHDVEATGWLEDAVSSEHPLCEVVEGVMLAGPKMAGAFPSRWREEWPPEPLLAGHVLVRLKKARSNLRDAVAGLDSADQEGLATPEWRSTTRREVAAILDEVHRYIAEVRAVLAEDE